jgi:hypothetical protein
MGRKQATLKGWGKRGSARATALVGSLAAARWAPAWRIERVEAAWRAIVSTQLQPWGSTERPGPAGAPR